MIPRRDAACARSHLTAFVSARLRMIRMSERRAAHRAASRGMIAPLEDDS